MKRNESKNNRIGKERRRKGEIGGERERKREMRFWLPFVRYTIFVFPGIFLQFYLIQRPVSSHELKIRLK